MNISKALKIKNRHIAEIQRLRGILSRDNSWKVDAPPATDHEALYTLLDNAIASLVGLKSAIGIASAPISGKLALLSELKGQLNWVQSLPVREGPENHYRETTPPQVWTAYNTQAKVDQQAADFQIAINRLQDEVDEFNARTQVEVD